MLSQDSLSGETPGKQSMAPLLLPCGAASVSGTTKPKSPLAVVGWECPAWTRLA
jgi:hypothetical protein